MKSEYINIQKTDYGFIINENINKTLFNKIFFIILLVKGVCVKFATAHIIAAIAAWQDL